MDHERLAGSEHPCACCLVREPKLEAKPRCLLVRAGMFHDRALATIQTGHGEVHTDSA
jgi:hypothetical protein